VKLLGLEGTNVSYISILQLVIARADGLHCLCDARFVLHFFRGPRPRRFQLSNAPRSGGDQRRCPGSGNRRRSFPARTPGKALDRGLVLSAGKAGRMGSSLLDRRICTAYLLSTAPLRLSNRAAAFFHTRPLPIERLGSTLSYLFGASATP
jgi:hypothetical protein